MAKLIHGLYDDRCCLDERIETVTGEIEEIEPKNSWFGTRIPAAGVNKEQVVTLRFGATSKLGGVSIWSVPAAHSNGISPVFLSGYIAKEPGG